MSYLYLDRSRVYHATENNESLCSRVENSNPVRKRNYVRRKPRNLKFCIECMRKLKKTQKPWWKFWD